MVLSSGFYSLQDRTIYLIPDSADPGFIEPTTTTPSDPIKFRRDKDSWLSIDDGLIGRYGTPDHLRARIDGQTYRVWVEQRGRDQTKFGLIPTDESGTYSNKFIGISQDGEFKIEDEWNKDNRTVWVISTKWDGQPGV
ncbi:hypothetical protein K439DRAFT_1625278 [Ramaria rubella]|nr:hypothetical protein K439DRAFT_1625278 [Ramaria rubella]